MFSRFSSKFLRRIDLGLSEYLSPLEDLSESLLLLESVYVGLSRGMDSRWDSSSSYWSIAQSRGVRVVAGGLRARNCFGGGCWQTAVLMWMELGRDRQVVSPTMRALVAYSRIECTKIIVELRLLVLWFDSKSFRNIVCFLDNFLYQDYLAAGINEHQYFGAAIFC